MHFAKLWSVFHLMVATSDFRRINTVQKVPVIIVSNLKYWTFLSNSDDRG